MPDVLATARWIVRLPWETWFRVWADYPHTDALSTKVGYALVQGKTGPYDTMGLVLNTPQYLAVRAIVEAEDRGR